MGGWGRGVSLFGRGGKGYCVGVGWGGVGGSAVFWFWASIRVCVRAAEQTKRVEMEEVGTKACTCVWDRVGGGRVREENQRQRGCSLGVCDSQKSGE